MNEKHVLIRAMVYYDAIELLIYHRLDEAMLYYTDKDEWVPVTPGAVIENTPKLHGHVMALMQHQNNYTMLEAILEWAFITVLTAIPDWKYVEPREPVKSLYDIQKILDPVYCRWDI